MSRTDPRPRRPTALVAAVIAVAAVVTAVVPGTSSGFVSRITNGANTAATAPYFTCTAAATADKSTAVFQYALRETSGSLFVTDSSGAGNTGIYRGTMRANTTTPMACPRDTGSAYVLNGTSSYVSTSTRITNPTVFSEEAWFKTTVAGGKIIGFGSSQTGSSTQNDRHVYVSTTGQIVFGAYNGTTQVITSPDTYTDGDWHHVAATMSPATGMRLYIDGDLVASNASYTAGENYAGYVRIGYDNTANWPGSGTQYYFNGSLRFAAFYTSVLTPAQVLNHYASGQ